MRAPAVLLRTIEADNPFGELCLHHSNAYSGTTASAPVASEAIEITLSRLLGDLRGHKREGPLRVDVPALTVYLGRIVHSEQ